MRRKHRGSFHGGNGGIPIKTGDPNEQFILRECLIYLNRIMHKYPVIDDDFMELLTWLFDEENRTIADFIAASLHDEERSRFEEDLADCLNDPQECMRIIARAIKRSPNRIMRGLSTMLKKLLQQKIAILESERTSDIEKNILKFKEMFGLTDHEVSFCIFLFVVNAHNNITSYFEDHLVCGGPIGRKYLMAALNISQSQLSGILSGNLSKINMFTFDKSLVRIDDEYLEFFQNSSNEYFHDKFFKQVCSSTIPLKFHFVDNDKTQYILDLLRNKPVSSTHILLYGPPGTGKTSYASGIAQETGLKTYEIIRGDENKTIERRTAIMACLNMTNNNDKSLVIVDEADNILNTENSWFMRGETQDKGWLNQFLEEPGARIVWITNSIDFIEDSVLRRFAFSLYFPEFNQKQRAHLWETILRKNRVKRFFHASDINRLAKQYPMSAGIIDLAVKKAVETCSHTKIGLHHAITMALNAHLTLKNSGRAPVMKDNIEESYSIEGLNTNGNIEAMMRQVKRFDQHLRVPVNAFRANMNILFYGPPGTGKSELARYLAETLDRKMITRKASDILDMYVGQSEKNISRMFAEAEQSEAVLIIDEIDSLLFSRNMAQRSWEFSRTNEFLSQMERFRGILLGTTNALARLDQASIRRFNHKIGFDYLTPEGNRIFYNRLLQPLINKSMPEDAESALKKITDLAPGDFRIVRDRFCFYTKQELSHALLIDALRKESQMKDLYKGRKPIGF